MILWSIGSNYQIKLVIYFLNPRPHPAHLPQASCPKFYFWLNLTHLSHLREGSICCTRRPLRHSSFFLGGGTVHFMSCTTAHPTSSSPTHPLVQITFCITLGRRKDRGVTTGKRRGAQGQGEFQTGSERGGACTGGEHLLCIQLPENDGRRPEKDQSPEVREAGWQAFGLV